MSVVDRSRSLAPAIVLVAVVSGLFGTGCDAATDAAAFVILPPAKEEKLGNQVEQEYLKKNDVDLYEGEKVNQYIQRLGKEAVAVSDSPDPIEYEFKVIDAPNEVNAFAMPGGQIYFYTGLLKKAENEAEVMSVMCHEVAHVSERHIAKQLSAKYGAQALAQAALGKNAGDVAKLATALATNGALLQYTRKKEKEADEVGFKYEVDAGYDPHGFVTFFEKLKSEKGARLPVWLSSHPLPADRVEAARKRIGDRSFEGAKVGESSHQQIVQAIEANSGGESSSGGDVGDSADAGM